MPRPDSLGLEVSVKSLDDVDPVLHELSWLHSEQDRLDALAKQKIDSIKKEFQEKAVVTICDTTEGGEDIEDTVTFADRIDALEKPLGTWVAKNLRKHLDGKKKSIDFPHGTIGLRQQPLVVEIPEGTSEKVILDTVDNEAEGIIGTIRGWAVRRLKTLACFVGDVLKIEVKLNLKGIKDALEDKRLTKEQIEALGLTIREASDDAVLKPAKTVVS
ncbi:MAG: host-nuclease inhibitor Gam family protein [Schlesneria sp.]